MKITDWIIAQDKDKTIQFNLKNNPKLIGITGTIGKTTTLELLYLYLCKNNYNVMCIGTSGIKLNTNLIYNKDDFQTTSFHDSKLLAKYFKIALLEKCDYILLEITAETIYEQVYKDLDFDVIGLTWFNTDTVRSFNSQSDYLNAKLSLFKDNKINKIIINKEAVKFVSEFKKLNLSNVKYFSSKNETDYYCINYGISKIGELNFDTNINPGYAFYTKMISTANLDNLLCMIAIINELNLYNRTILNATFRQIKTRGRYCRFNLYGRDIIVDTGYNGIDGLPTFVKELPKCHDIVVASTYNFIDDRRNEDPEVLNYRHIKGKFYNNNFDTIIITKSHRGDPNHEIKNICDIISVCPRAVVEESRIKAIKRAWLSSKPNDRIILIGTGSERNIKIGDMTYDDEDLIRFIAKYEEGDF